MKSHKQAKLKLKNLCLQVFRGFQSISLKIIYINVYLNFYTFVYLFLYYMWGFGVPSRLVSTVFCCFPFKVAGLPQEICDFFFKVGHQYYSRLIGYLYNKLNKCYIHLIY